MSIVQNPLLSGHVSHHPRQKSKSFHLLISFNSAADKPPLESSELFYQITTPCPLLVKNTFFSSVIHLSSTTLTVIVIHCCLLFVLARSLCATDVWSMSRGNVALPCHCSLHRSLCHLLLPSAHPTCLSLSLSLLVR